MRQSELTREFTQWIKAQPLDRSFNYGDTLNCAIATFLKETGAAIKPTVGSDNWYCMKTEVGGYISRRLDRAVGSDRDEQIDPPPVTVAEILEKLNA